MTKISVIMPVYNAEEFLLKSVESALAQDLYDIQLICIDDGSDDDSSRILKSIQQKDDRVILEKQSNQGSGVARNKGLKIATGEFITFLDSDDWYPSIDVLSTLYEKAVEYDQKIAGGSFIRHYHNGKIESEFKGIYKAYKFDKEEVISFKNYQFDYGYHRFIYNRKMLIDNDIDFPDYLRFQDPPFFLNAMIKAGTFVAVNKQVYAYRKSHKDIEWDLGKVKGLLSGLLENLIMSRKMGLASLHWLILTRTQKEFWHIINQKISEPVVYYLVYRIYKSVDIDLIKVENPQFRFDEFNIFKLFN